MCTQINTYLIVGGALVHLTITNTIECISASSVQARLLEEFFKLFRIGILGLSQRNYEKFRELCNLRDFQLDDLNTSPEAQSCNRIWVISKGFQKSCDSSAMDYHFEELWRLRYSMSIWSYLISIPTYIELGANDTSLKISYNVFLIQVNEVGNRRSYNKVGSTY